MAIETLLYRQIIGQFATGVAVITAAVGGQAHGMTANALCSVSLDPLLVLICVDARAQTCRLIERAGGFAINILAEHQEALSRHFARHSTPGEDRMAEIPHRPGVHGAPILEGTLAYLECRLWATYPGGDHQIFVGEVVELGAGQAERPLLFYRGRYAHLEPLDLLGPVHPLSWFT